MALTKKTTLALTSMVFLIALAIGTYFLYKYITGESFCDSANFDMSRKDYLLMQGPYPENAFAGNSGDYKQYLYKENSDSVVGVNQHPQDSSSNPTKFIEF
jgi:hypothetical protein